MLITDQEQITYWKLTWKKERDLKLEETEPKVSFFFFKSQSEKPTCHKYGNTAFCCFLYILDIQ